MVSYIGDDDDIIATYQDLAKEYSISQPEFWQSTETDMISYAALFVLAKLLVSQFISGAYEDHLILAVYCAGAVLSVIPYAAFVRFDVKKCRRHFFILMKPVLYTYYKAL